MTREDIKKIMPEATDEQITAFLNQSGKELAIEKAKVEQAKNRADGATGDLKKQNDDLQRERDALQAQLDELNAANLSDIEKARSDAEKLAKELEKEKAKIAALENEKLISQKRNDAVEKFHISVDQAKQVVKDDGSMDFDVLGQIMTEKETSAASSAKEQTMQEITSNATNPGGGSTVSNKDEKPADVEVAESISFGSVDQNVRATRDYYK